jgi:hypothetical protein
MPTFGRIYLPSFQEAMSGVAAMLDAADTGSREVADGTRSPWCWHSA